MSDVDRGRPYCSTQTAATVIGSVFLDSKTFAQSSKRVDTIGGVGHNVARALASFGLKVTLGTMLDYSAAALAIETSLTSADIRVIANRRRNGLGRFESLVNLEGEGVVVGATPPDWDVVPAHAFLQQITNAVAESAVVCIELGLPNRIVSSAIELARDSGAKTCGLPTRRRSLDSQRPYLRSLDYLSLNRLEAEAITGIQDVVPLDQIASVLTSAGPPNVLVTAGADGAYAIGFGHPGTSVTAPCVTVVDTTGAGDALVGGAVGLHILGRADPLSGACNLVASVLASSDSYAVVKPTVAEAN